MERGPTVITTDVPAHGTRNRYQYRAEPCRCPDCRAAHAAYHRRYRARLRHRRSGIINGKRVEWDEPTLPFVDW